MKSLREHIPPWLSLGLLLLLVFANLILLWNFSSTTHVGEEDFIVYWSATHLFENGLNPYDPELMLSVQREQGSTREGGTPMAWNPPPLFVILLPLAWLPFSIAKYLWLVINIILIVSACFMLAHIYFPSAAPGVVVLYLLLAFSLPQVVTGIFIGQVTYLVFFGLAACMTLIKKEQWFWAGAVLILTTIKPHLVILSIIYLLFYMVQRRRYSGWAGLILAGLACMFVLFLFRPLWIQDLMGEMEIAPVHWITPTIGGLLSYFGMSDITRYIIVLFLPLPFILLRHKTAVPLELAVALLTLITVPTTFFGWSFDQNILLIPIAQVFGWICLSKDRTITIWFASASILGLAGVFLQRFFNLNDVFYVWYPMFWWLIFGLEWRHFSKTASIPHQPASYS